MPTYETIAAFPVRNRSGHVRYIDVRFLKADGHAYCARGRNHSTHDDQPWRFLDRYELDALRATNPDVWDRSTPALVSCRQPDNVMAGNCSQFKAGTQERKDCKAARDNPSSPPPLTPSQVTNTLAVQGTTLDTIKEVVTNLLNNDEQQKKDLIDLTAAANDAPAFDWKLWGGIAVGAVVAYFLWRKFLR